jgi:hypothetical protein
VILIYDSSEDNGIFILWLMNEKQSNPFLADFELSALDHFKQLDVLVPQLVQGNHKQLDFRILAPINF